MEASGMAKSKIIKDYEQLLEKVKMQPGITELMEIHGEYEIYIKESEAYLKGLDADTISFSSNHTA
jgi:hypothetical protein